MDEEWNLFGAMSGAGPVAEEVVIRTLDRLHGDGRRVYDAYREARTARGESATATEILNAASGDSWFVVASERIADAQSRFQPQTFSYVFDWKSPTMDGALGSCHALDIPFTFGTHGRDAAVRRVGAGGGCAGQLRDGFVDGVRAERRSLDARPELAGVRG